jgi:ribosomal protein S20
MSSNTTQKTKVCTRCKKRRKVVEFYKDKHMKDGLSSWCKLCTKEYDRAYTARKKAERSNS